MQILSLHLDNNMGLSQSQFEFVPNRVIKNGITVVTTMSKAQRHLAVTDYIAEAATKTPYTRENLNHC